MMQMSEEHFWTEAFHILAKKAIGNEDEVRALGICLMEDPRFPWRHTAFQAVLEEGYGTKISDVCMKVFEKFLNNKLLMNPRVEARELANEVEEALSALKRIDWATGLLPQLLKVRFVEVQSVN